MSGIRNFKIASCLLLALTGLARADELTLADNARLTGTIRSIHESGVVELSSELSPEPLFLKAEAVEKAEFSTTETSSDHPGTLIELTNGDLLPASLDNMDDNNLYVVTEDAGKLTIPRTALKSMQLGVRKRPPIYIGPKNAAEWSNKTDDSRRWNFSEGALVANGPAYGTKKFEIPRKFILKYTLKWQANPNFQIYFADPLTPNVEAVDRYYLQFNGAGLEIKRESSKGKHFQTVILVARTPDQFPDNQVTMEIRVDRSSSRIHLLLNGEPEGAGVDPVADPPQGGGVALINSAATGLSQEIRDISLAELDNVQARHRAEERGDTKLDSLISRDEDRWSGRLLSIRKRGNGNIFSFKSDFQEEPLELTDTNVSTVLFAISEPAAPANKEHAFALRLKGEGSIQVASCSFSAETVTARHPLLGLLNIQRSGVVAMERLNAKPDLKASE